MKQDQDFQRFLENITELKTQRQKHAISLNEADRRNEMRQQERRLKTREKTDNTINPQDDGLQANERSLNADLDAEKKQKNAKDVLLNEAIHIVNDVSILMKKNPKLIAPKTDNSTEK